MNTPSTKGQQRGFLMITTLVILGMLTAIGVAQVSINTTQTQVTTNTTDAAISFEKSEGAVNEAINRMLDYTYTSTQFASNSNGLYLFNHNEQPIWQTVNWGSLGAVIPSFGGLHGGQAHYVIEELPSVVQPGQNMRTLTRVYRITARALGLNGTSSVLIQSTIQLR